MLKIRKLTVGQLQTNCYLVMTGNEALIIDPGDDADYILRIIADEGIAPTKVIATHGHYDHILAVTELKLAYQIPFLMHKEDEFLLKRMSASAAHFGKIVSDPPPKIDKYLKEGESLKIARLHAPGVQATGGQGNYKLKIVHTSGHTPGSISLYSKVAKAVFVGDLIFAGGGMGRTDFAYSNRKDLLNSVGKLLKLPEDTVVYSGHGEETTVKRCQQFFAKLR